MTTHIEIGARDTLQITKITRNKEPFIPFIMLGQEGNTQIKGANTMDAVRIMLSFTPNEQWLMDMLITLGDETTLQARIQGKSLNTSEKRKLLAAYKSLNSRDIVKRIKREYYMLNPMFIIPRKHRNALYAYYLSLGTPEQLDKPDLSGNYTETPIPMGINAVARITPEAYELGEKYHDSSTPESEKPALLQRIKTLNKQENSNESNR